MHYSSQIKSTEHNESYTINVLITQETLCR